MVPKKTFENLIRHLVTVEEDSIASSGQMRRRLEKYIRKIESLLATVKVAEGDPPKAQPCREFPFVLAESIVTLQSETGEETVKIVSDMYKRNGPGPTMYYLSEGGTAFIGKSLNESVEADIGKGLKTYSIKKIQISL